MSPQFGQVIPTDPLKAQPYRKKMRHYSVMDNENLVNSGEVPKDHPELSQSSSLKSVTTDKTRPPKREGEIVWPLQKCREVVRNNHSPVITGQKVTDRRKELKMGRLALNLEKSGETQTGQSRAKSFEKRNGVQTSKEGIKIIPSSVRAPISKNESKLSPKRKAKKALLGAILGDGHLNKNSLSARYLGSHSLKQIDYLIWKMKLLYPILGSYNLGWIPPRTGWSGSAPRIKALSLTSKYLKHIYDDFYSMENGRPIKRARLNVLRRFTPLSLAVFYQDDGNLKVRKGRICRIRLHVEGFSEFDRRTMQRYFLETWGIEFQSKKSPQGDFHLESRNRTEGKKFLKIVEPYICESMRYKVDPSLQRPRGQVLKSGQEIVGSLQECKELIRNGESSMKELERRLISWMQHDWNSLKTSGSLNYRGWVNSTISGKT